MKIREKISKPLNRKETAYVHLLRILITICQWSQVSVTYRVIIISKFSKLKNLFEQLLACFLLSINVADCFCEWRPKKWFWNPLSSNTKVVNWCREGGKAIAEQGLGSETRNTSETAGLGTSYSRIRRGIQATWPRPWGRKNIV